MCSFEIDRKSSFPLHFAGTLYAAGYKSDLRRHQRSEKLSQWRKNFSILDFISSKHLIQLHPSLPADAFELKSVER